MHMKKRNITIIIGLFIILLTLARILWMDAFHDVSQVDIEAGQLELVDWDAQNNSILLLDGEWEFYPSTLLYGEKGQPNKGVQEPQFIHVPDEWNDAFPSEESTPFGFGTYRLQLFVNPDEHMNYSIYVPSVRSASEVYVNGRLVAGSGEVGTSEATYQAKKDRKSVV